MWKMHNVMGFEYALWKTHTTKYETTDGNWVIWNSWRDNIERVSEHTTQKKTKRKSINFDEKITRKRSLSFGVRLIVEAVSQQRLYDQNMMSDELSCIADDDDFASLKRLVDNDDGWNLELCKANTLVWTRSVPGCNFQMVKINSRFEDIEPDCVFDVLLDPDYRKEWDSHMLESFDIGNFNVNNDVGYYASKSCGFFFSLFFSI